MKQIIAYTEQDTLDLAAQLAVTVPTGTVIALYGTLGAGKTAFCRGFIQTLCGAEQDVPSPTFTLLQTYETSRFPIFHFDMYRLKSPDEAYELGIEDAFVEGVSLIEWPEKIGSLLPRKRMEMMFEIQPDGSRLITIKE